MSLEDRVADAIAGRAAEWWLLNRQRNASERERNNFLAWLRQSPAHVQAYLSIAAADKSLGEAAHDWPETAQQLLARVAAEEETDPLPIQRAGPVNREGRLDGARVSRWRFAYVAGTSLIVATILLGGWLLGGGRLTGRTYETAHAEQGSWLLPDGSVLHLDSDSRAVLHFSGPERVVALERGQAMFQVAKDPRRRFRVDAGNAQIVALGTEFDVDRNSTGTRVIVLEGQVAVLRGPLQPPAVPTLALTRATSLKAGEQLEIDSSHVGAPRPADVPHSAAWLHREIVFDNLSLAQVIADFNRYAPKPIEIEDESLKRIPISGVFGAYDVESFVAFLRGLDGVKVVEGPSHIRLYRWPRAPEEPVAVRNGRESAINSHPTVSEQKVPDP